PEAVARVIAAQRPDALLPVPGSRAAARTAAALRRRLVLDRFGVELLGVDPATWSPSAGATHLPGAREFDVLTARDRTGDSVVALLIEHRQPSAGTDPVSCAPAITVTGPEIRQLHEAALARSAAVGAGVCRVRAEIDPDTHQVAVTELSPALPGSGLALAEAVGRPIGVLGTKLALGYRLGEIEQLRWPTTDAVAVSVSRVDGRVTTTGRTFAQAF